MNNIMTVRELIIWLSAFCLAFVTKYFNGKYINVLLMWITIVIIVGNAKRIYNKKYEYILCYIRRIMYIVPFMLAFFLADLTIYFQLDKKIYLLIGMIIAICIHLPKMNEWIFFWEIKMADMNGKKYDYLSYIIMLLGVPFAEELFFRGFILSQSNNIFVGCLVSIILFVLNHFGTKWGNRFSLYDLIVQIIFSILSCWLFLKSGSIIPCFVAHFTYNFPVLLVYLGKFVVTIKSEK